MESMKKLKNVLKYFILEEILNSSNFIFADKAKKSRCCRGYSSKPALDDDKNTQQKTEKKPTEPKKEDNKNNENKANLEEEEEQGEEEGEEEGEQEEEEGEQEEGEEEEEIAIEKNN